MNIQKLNFSNLAFSGLKPRPFNIPDLKYMTNTGETKPDKDCFVRHADGFDGSVTEYKNGQKLRKLYIGNDVSLEDRIVSKAQKTYDASGKIKSIIEYSPEYIDKNGAVYAKSSKREDLVQENISVDYDFETTDYSIGNNPVREFFYKEHKNTIRTINENEICYYDENSGKLYARETCKAKKRSGADNGITCIENFETGEIAKITELSNVYMVMVTKNGKKIKSALFEKTEAGCILKYIEEFNDYGKRVTKREVL